MAILHKVAARRSQTCVITHAWHSRLFSLDQSNDPNEQNLLLSKHKSGSPISLKLGDVISFYQHSPTV